MERNTDSTVESVLNQYFFPLKAQLKCVDSLTHRNICWYNKGRLLYNLFLLYTILSKFYSNRMILQLNYILSRF